MKTVVEYKIDFENIELKDQVKEFLNHYNKKDTALHSLEVANEAQRLASILGLSEEKAFKAGLLHDISVVIPNEERILLQESLNKVVLKEEKELPMILHQKQSVFISTEIFGIKDKEILSAIESHTTLRKDATQLDKLVFIADKIKWDRSDNAPYLDDLERALQISLDEACRVYINWALGDIVVLHPWLKDAMDDLNIAYLTD
ncbi:bis(5'-nucleosyl)-tetraphosphatase (symmetrical) YqeK (plasmid) [Vagococcus sp. JNUCC 83]